MSKKNKEKPLVSIIIAAYNEENYIKRCIESVQNQTYEEIEIIVVDDGSTDKTGEICKNLAEKDTRINYITQNNSGLPLTRKKGFENAKGKYIQFIDGDDWCEPCRTEYLVNTIENDESDIVFSSAYRHREDGVVVICNLPIKEGCYLVSDIIPIYIKPLFGDLKKDSLITTGYVWCCLYKKEILKNIIFYPDIILHEDEIINLQAMANSSKISIIKEPLYHYNRRLNTLSKKNTYWNGYWHNMTSMYSAKKIIGTNFFKNDNEYLQRLATALYQKFLRTIRNETHYKNPAHFFGGLKNLYIFDTVFFLNDAYKKVIWSEFSKVEKVLIYCIKKKIFFIPYFYYAIKTNRMRNFQEKTKN